jgi:hypothetical protein
LEKAQYQTTIIIVILLALLVFGGFGYRRMRR